MISRQHPFFPKFLELMREAAGAKPVYDLGTSARFAKEVGLVRHLFDEREYFAGGYHPDFSLGPDSCNFHCDVQDLVNIANGSAGCVLGMEVLEHVVDPWKAVREFNRILRPGGIAIVAVPFLASYHGKRPRQMNPLFELNEARHELSNDHARYGDYWRFTHEGITRVFAEAGFSRVEVWPIDGSVICRLELLRVYGALCKVRPLRWLIARLDKPMLGRATSLHFAKATK